MLDRDPDILAAAFRPGELRGSQDVDFAAAHKEGCGRGTSVNFNLSWFLGRPRDSRRRVDDRKYGEVEKIYCNEGVLDTGSGSANAVRYVPVPQQRLAAYVRKDYSLGTVLGILDHAGSRSGRHHVSAECIEYVNGKY